MLTCQNNCRDHRLTCSEQKAGSRKEVHESFPELHLPKYNWIFVLQYQSSEESQYESDQEVDNADKNTDQCNSGNVPDAETGKDDGNADGNLAGKQGRKGYRKGKPHPDLPWIVRPPTYRSTLVSFLPHSTIIKTDLYF